MNSKLVATPKSLAPIEASLVIAVRINQLKHTTWLVIFAAAIVASLLLNVAGKDSVSVGGMVLPEVCTLKRCTGWDCPGCGLTRSFVSMGHAEWQAAWQFHPAGPLWFAVFLIQIPYRIWQLVRLRRGMPEFRTRFDWYLIAGMLGTLFVAWGYRLITN